MYHYQETVSHSLIIRRKRLDLDLSTHGTEKPTTTRNLPDPRNTSSLLTVNSVHFSTQVCQPSFLQFLTASYSFSQRLTASHSFLQLLTASYSLNPLLSAMPAAWRWQLWGKSCKLFADWGWGNTKTWSNHNFLRQETWTFCNTRYKIQDIFFLDVIQSVFEETVSPDFKKVLSFLSPTKRCYSLNSPIDKKQHYVSEESFCLISLIQKYFLI